MPNAANAIHQLKLQHTFFLLILILAFACALIYAGNVSIAENESLERNGSVVAVIVSVAALMVGFNLFKRNMMGARNSQESTVIRLRKYSKACLLWWSLISIPGLLSLGLFVVTAYYSFIALAALHLLILLVFMPRRANITVLLRLTEKDLAK